MKSRDRRAQRMSEFVTNMFQYNVTVGITRSEIIFLHVPLALSLVSKGNSGKFTVCTAVQDLKQPVMALLRPQSQAL